MGRLGEVAIVLALFVLLGTLHGTRGQYDDYSYEYNDEADGYDYEEEEYYQEEDAVVMIEREEAVREGADPIANSDVQQRELLDQGGLGASSDGHQGVLYP